MHSFLRELKIHKQTFYRGREARLLLDTAPPIFLLF